MASTTTDTVVASPMSDASTFLAIAAEIRLYIYKEIFRGFTVHMYTEYSHFAPVERDQEIIGYGARNLIEAKVDAALLLICKMVRNESQILYDDSVRFLVAYDTAIDAGFSKVYAQDFYTRITWLSISQDHTKQLDFTRYLPNLKKLEINQGGFWKISPMKPENPATGLALNKSMYDEENKARIKDRYVNLPEDCWVRKALDSLRGKVQITHFFRYYRRTFPAGEMSFDYGTVTVKFEIDTLKTLYKQVSYPDGRVEETWYYEGGKEIEKIH